MQYQQLQLPSLATHRNGTAFDLLFYTSFSINVCVILYLMLFYVANQFVVCFVKATSPGLAGKFRNAHQTKQQFLHNVYFDSFIYTIMVCATTVLILTTKAMDKPFQANTTYSLHILFSSITGVYIFLLFKELYIAPSGPNKWMNSIVYGVSIAALATAVITKEDVVLVTIIVISNGDVVNINAARLMKRVLELEGTSCYRIASFMGTYATVVFRALLPIGFIVLSLINGKPFNMSYPSVFFFFVGLLFFGALNTWQVNAALARICRKNHPNIVRSREVHAVPKPEDRNIIARIELPPTYDEVCGAESSIINMTEPAEGELGACAEGNIESSNTRAINVHVRHDSIASAESGLGNSSIHLNVIQPMNDKELEGFECTKEKAFVEIDLGVPTESVDLRTD